MSALLLKVTELAQQEIVPQLLWFADFDVKVPPTISSPLMQKVLVWGVQVTVLQQYSCRQQVMSGSSDTDTARFAGSCFSESSLCILK